MFFLVAAVAATAATTAESWRVGVATCKFTPSGPIWLAGYANRTAPSDGVDLELFGNAFALDDGAGGWLVIVTLDLIGVSAVLHTHAERTAREVVTERDLLNAGGTFLGLPAENAGGIAKVRPSRRTTAASETSQVGAACS